MPLEVQEHHGAMGELFIWTDIDPKHEKDFNLWYDREHMAERAQIPGFMWARRYRARSGDRPYLALYRTESMQVFKSPEYRRAFDQQTEWSLANFARMRNTNRRVMIVSPLQGAGAGGALGLLKLADVAMAQRAAELAPSAQQKLEGVLSLRVLDPDPALSTPLPSEDLSQRTLHPFLVIDTTTESSAAAAIRWLSDQLGLDDSRGDVFQLLWELRSADLTSTNH